MLVLDDSDNLFPEITKCACDGCGVDVRLEYDSDLDRITTKLSWDMCIPGRYFKHVGGYGTKHDNSLVENVYCDNCIFERIFK